MTPQQLLVWLRTSRNSLPMLGKVHDQETATFVNYDPYRLTKTLQAEVLDYMDNPPRDENGFTRYLTVLAGRQLGKSLVVEYGVYPKVAYNPGHDHVCIADTRERADYLHKRVHHLHSKWEPDLRSPTISSKESRQLTFDSNCGGKMRVLSAEDGAVGIGQSPDSFHASECAFWSDFSGSMFLIKPSLNNRKNVRVVFECTPWELDNDWYDHCHEVKAGKARDLYVFKPFWDGHLNARMWPKEWKATQEELELMNKYGPFGLTWENLAFRRFVMEDDKELKRNPDKFLVFYPFDDIGCWLSTSIHVIPEKATKKHIDRVSGLLVYPFPYVEYQQPEEGGVYVIGVDPCGHAARDHASFQVLRLFDDTWEQVAVFADHCDPLTFAKKVDEVGRKYNNARVCVESNGVGQACIALLREWGYPHIVYEAEGKPGVTTTGAALDKFTTWLIDALLENLELNDHATVAQLRSYKHDKRIEEGAQLELIRGSSNRRRRERHHWDRVSALIMAVIVARRTTPGKRRVVVQDHNARIIHSGEYSLAGRKKKLAEVREHNRLVRRDHAKRRFRRAV